MGRILANGGPPVDNPKQGLVFKDEWPWGNQSPENKADIDKYAITPFGKFSALQEVGHQGQWL